LQINLSPGDYRLVKDLLPHQLDTLTGQTDETLLTIETKPSKGRFAEGWYEHKELLYDFLSREIVPNYQVRLEPVDYREQMKSEVAGFFFNLKNIPDKDFRGGPFYAYFYGLYRAKNDLVFHLDSDIFLGGRSKQWISEAAGLLTNRHECLFVSPLPGPPHEQDLLTGQSIKEKIAPFTYKLNGMSTRVFMTSKSKLAQHKPSLQRPSVFNCAKALLKGNPSFDLPEHILSNLLDDVHDRIDFLGTGKGMWSLHPPFRTETLYVNIESIIRNVENGDMPKRQQGYYDMIDAVCDWSEGRERLEQNRWWKKILRSQ
jgi:hypothetical protein